MDLASFASGEQSVGSAGHTGLSGSGGHSGTGQSSGGTGVIGSAGGLSNAGAPGSGGATLGSAGLGDPGAGAGSMGCDAGAGLVMGVNGCVPVATPRLLSPLSTARVTAHQARLSWLPAPGNDGAFVQVCLDRSCASPTESFQVDGVSEELTTALTPGVYFWRVFGRSKGVTSHLSSATWQFTVGHHGDPSQSLPHSSWGTTFDANGDGYADVILGAPDMGNGNVIAPSEGHAYVFMGSATGLASVAATTLTGPSNGSSFGGVACSAGDVNGDGYADAIIGAEGTSTHRGSAYVYLGGPSGLANTPIASLDAPSGGSFGDAVSSAGDINGDGYADVIVGARYVRVPLVATQYAGRAYLYFGSATGIDTSSPITLAGSTAIGTDFGQVVASAGDIDADGHADLLVSGNDAVVMSNGSYYGEGRAYLYQGSALPFSATASVELQGPSDQEFVTVGSASDFNADGYADLVFGALGETTEYLGSPQGFAANISLSMPFAQQPGTTSAYSYRVVGAGDINGDGYDDAIASYDEIYSYFGGPNGASDPPAVFTPPGESASIYGFDVIRAGDINGDGYDDVVIGAKFADQFAGRAYVYFGTATGLAATPALILIGPDGIGGRFG